MPHQPYVRPQLKKMLTTSTTIIAIAGRIVSPAPRRHALAINIGITNGSDHDSIRRYETANTITPVATPRMIDALIDCPQTLLANERCRAPVARAMIAVLPVPTAPTI